MGKTFEEYQAQHTGEPFPFPMPGGKSVMVPKPSLRLERKAVASARQAGSMLEGLREYVTPQDFALIEEAWGELPPDALSEVLGDMREHFGWGNFQP